MLFRSRIPVACRDGRCRDEVNESAPGHHDAIIIMMRTTVNLPDDVYHAARSLASLKGISLGDALAELARQGQNPGIRIDTDKAFPCFRLPEGAEPITLERTLAAEDEL